MSDDTSGVVPSVSANDDGETFDYIFGFGSIMNTTTHAPWLPPSSKGGEQKVAALSGSVATLKQGFGYERQWNFRSSTGFTALGVCPAEKPNVATDINGVLFRVPRSWMPSFDRREVGYKKVAIPLECLELASSQPSGCNPQTKFDLGPIDHMWLYVPLPTHTTHADDNHPLLQSYVDTVLQGCLEWGGEAMAEQFVVTTGGWSAYFLNDTPSSRRPWLYRKEYNTIDRLLKNFSEKTHYGDRRHPEEFASAFHRRMKGTWGLLRRNPNFTGRDAELGQLQSRLSAQDQGRQRIVVKVEVAGMGGVGKTQLVTEYCYRHFPSQYGLVVWLNAESADSLVADYRQLLADLAAEADDNPNKDADEIVGEVKTRLFRSQVPWLLIFDNIENRALLDNFVPRGAGMKGHVLVTTRLVDLELGNESADTLLLGCFSPSESMELLRRAAGPHNMEGGSNVAAAKAVCERLGNLPLALGMAAAYMQRCDATCREYLDRYVASEKSGQSLLRHGKLHDYSFTVASSLSLSLGAIEKESVVACDMLRLLCFLGPDQITKPLLRHLLNAKNKADEDPDDGTEAQQSLVPTSALILACGLIIGVATFLASGAVKRRAGRNFALVSLSVLSALVISSPAKAQPTVKKNLELRRSSSSIACFSSFEYEQSDLAWDILKSFSLLSVKEGKGSMHRLLAQALRASQSQIERRHNLRICVNAVSALWTFHPGQIETWKESLQVLEHVKHVVPHTLDCDLSSKYVLKTGRLSTEAGVFSAMVLNAFIEAEASLDLSLKLFESSKQAKKTEFRKARAEALHELGRILRYQGNYVESEKSLLASLDIYNSLNHRDNDVSRGVADTLHELGVLEVKKHNLDSAASILQQSLAMRRGSTESCTDKNSECAATLHQLAAVHVARKPPSLEKAKSLLQEALGLSRQIGQRAATLKQLARVTIRQGLLDRAETYLEQALELYLELYDGNKLHINIAAVKFQQGALVLQREQLEEAWLQFSECLRIRRHVYAYARPVGSSSRDVDPTHLEVSCVLHELGRVAFAQGRYSPGMEMLKSERLILERLVETSTQTQTERLFQARLTNLTWVRKCAKELGNEDEAAQVSGEISVLKRMDCKSKESEPRRQSDTVALQQKSIYCRLLARRFALEKKEVRSSSDRAELKSSLSELHEEIGDAPPTAIRRAAIQFCYAVSDWMDKTVEERRLPILQACDKLRDVLRAQGLQVNDSISSRK